MKTRRQEANEHSRLSDLASETRVGEAKYAADKAARERQIQADRTFELSKLEAELEGMKAVSEKLKNLWDFAEFLERRSFFTLMTKKDIASRIRGILEIGPRTKVSS